MSDLVGRKFGNYRLIRLLGQGGFADVYLSEHIHLNTLAAIKVLRTQLVDDDITSFRKEARTIAHLMHPNIVRVLEFGVEGNIPFLVMDYAPSGTLRQRHHRGVALPTEVVVPYIKQVAAALQYAHNQKVIHRDIKPENMLLGRSNEVLLSDFGIAFVSQSILIQSMREASDKTAGTIVYMAPEQNQGKPGPASDQYALAVVVYEWLSGARPFNGSYMEIAVQHIHAPPPSLREKNPNIPPDVEKVIMTALAKDPAQRFGSVQAFANAFDQACQDEETYIISRSSLPSSSPSAIPGGREHTMEATLHGPFGRIVLGQTVLPIGRSQSNQLVINDRKASLRHAEIRPEGQGYSIVDLGSTNGTLINERPIEPNMPRLLNQGDAIRIGDTTLTYVVSSPQQMSSSSSEGSTLRAGYQNPPPPSSLTGYSAGAFQEYPSPVVTPSYTPPPAISFNTPSVSSAPPAQPVQPMPSVQQPYAQPAPMVMGTPGMVNAPPPVQQPYGPPVQQPYVPPIGNLPSGPAQKKRGGPLRGGSINRAPSSRAIILIVLALVVIVGSAGIFFVVRNNQIASDNTNATATAQNQAAFNANATKTFRAHATATFNANATTTAAAIPYPPYNTSKVNDALTKSSSSQWDEDTECTFTGKNYQVSLAEQGHFHTCFAESGTFTDFAYQVNMMIVQGDCGGLAFRATSTDGTGTYYVFEVCQDGTYNLFVEIGASNKTKTLISVQQSSAIHKGLNQTNLIAVVVQGSAINLYVNDQSKPITSITDTGNASNQGHIGLIADDTSSPTTVAYTSVRVWTY